MSSQHSHKKTFSLTEHLAEQRRQHRQQLVDLNPSLIGLGPGAGPGGGVGFSAVAANANGNIVGPIDDGGSSSDESDSDDEQSDNSGSEFDTESNGFLQPISTRQRRSLLKASGIRVIDSVEKDDCRKIRTSREICGCNCRDYCDPDTCACSQSGIKCQVRRLIIL